MHPMHEIASNHTAKSSTEAWQSHWAGRGQGRTHSPLGLRPLLRCWSSPPTAERPKRSEEARKRHALKRRSGVGKEGSGASAAPPRLRSACLSQLVKYSPSDNSCPALEASALNPSRRSLLELALILETQGTIQGWSAIKRGLW